MSSGHSGRRAGRLGRATAAAVAVAGGVVAGAAPAHAAIVASEQNTYGWEEVDTSCEAPDGSTMQILAETSVQESLRFKRHAASSNEGFLEARRVVESTYTNLDTGISWTSRTVEMEKDTALMERLDAERYLVKTVMTARTTYYDPQGEAYDRATEMLRLHLTLDTQGTPDPLDDAFENATTVKGAGSPAPDFCADAVAMTL